MKPRMMMAVLSLAAVTACGGEDEGERVPLGEQQPAAEQQQAAPRLPEEVQVRVDSANTAYAAGEYQVAALCILVAHVFYNTTIVLRMVGDFWSHMDPRLEQAARVLGANRWQALRKVTLPILMPAIAAASEAVACPVCAARSLSASTKLAS